ncbi:MAG: hypothetical protein AB4050_06520, partial [Synechococcus sp.]
QADSVTSRALVLTLDQQLARRGEPSPIKLMVSVLRIAHSTDNFRIKTYFYLGYAMAFDSS